MSAKYLEEVKPAFYAQRIPRVKMVSSKDSCQVIKRFYGCPTDDDTDLFRAMEEDSYLADYALQSSEKIGAIFGNAKGVSLGIGWFGQGKISSTTADIQGIIATACKLRASVVVLFHNHPSGSLVPSAADRKLTEGLNAVLALLDVTLLDHIIISTEGYYSFADQCENSLLTPKTAYLDALKSLIS